MESGKEPSSNARSSPSLLALLGILASFITLIGYFRSKLPNPQKQPINSITPQSNPREEKGGSEVLSAPVAQVPPSPTDAEQTCKYCHQKTPRWKKIAEITAVVSGVIYAGVTIFLWIDTRGALIVSQRAWVGVDRPIDVASITVDPKGKRTVSYIVTTKNFGNSVALSTTIASTPIAAIDKLRTATEDMCNQAITLSGIYTAKIQNRGPNFLPEHPSFGAMFPNETVGHHFDKDVEVGQWKYPLTIVGCVAYDDQFGKHRRTRFCYSYDYSVSGKETAPALIFQCPIGANDAN